MSRNVGTPRGMKLKADKLFSKIVRSRGACERCGAATNLQTAHIISRRFSNTRCDELNAFCLDAACHMYFTDHPVEFGIFVRDQIGDQYDYLLTQSQKTTKVDWSTVVGRLTERWNELEAAL